MPKTDVRNTSPTEPYILSTQRQGEIYNKVHSLTFFVYKCISLEEGGQPPCAASHIEDSGAPLPL